MAPRDRADETLRHDLVDRLVAAGTVRSAAVEAALRLVPRHRFVPDLDPVVAHDDRPQLVKQGPSGTLSTISQPTMIAVMLELADLEPGDRVLEIGTGTGYNAALLGRLVGAQGHVVSVDVEDDLVDRARDTLATLDCPQVSVHCADGALGWESGAPYDCVMATAGVDAVPDAWRHQTAIGGRILVPILDDQTLRVEVRRDDRWDTVATSPAAFIPLR